MQIDVAKRLQHTEEYYFSKKLREIDELNRQGARVINLGIGSPDLPPHPEVIETLNTNAQLPNVHGYQNYKGVPALRQAVADWYQRYYNATFNPNTEILPLIGSKEGIVHICMTYLQEGDQALIPNPGYPAYAAAVRLSGAEAITYNLTQEKNWLIDLDELKKQDLSKVKLMWINYPHMPTGASAPDAFYQELIQFAKEHNILICHDNPYSFILTDTPKSIMSIAGAKDVAIELNSLSKSSNMAGWRIGVLVGAEERINQVLRFKSNMDSGMFLPVQLAAAKALQLDASWYADLNKIYAERRQQVYEIMDLLACTYQKDQVGLFVWARIPEKYKNGYALSDAVLEKSRVFITPGGIFGDKGDQYIRISLCATVEVLKESIQRIKDSF
ncbi:MAG: aminotransferase class I/II-fold pyridoxal phosphate-dependent enzyme [Sphingobacterium sp.]|jgi:aspartate/methionine/tyrosine aminotransferase|uniref:pyridoxal phosphate-dependent aminotransferase n=1 Tax=Sphingobacterium sp. TaxID=341027 RepID=UPI00284EB7D5|nr:aminotransferase class I/II-fold pyridoxal phosphate-dependent enzyme [Sphingobacterium sp.]MDR3008502.1 aminotransferase class I/II-fold pyridoxal phosphate-dependent enzyme [Sphingobacterium sp.]